MNAQIAQLAKSYGRAVELSQSTNSFIARQGEARIAEVRREARRAGVLNEVLTAWLAS